MSIYVCSTCGCIENTATGGYWAQEMNYFERHGTKDGFKPLCSEHNPEIGKWHGEWPKKRADGYVQDRQGFVYAPNEAEGYFKHMGPFKPVDLPAEVQCATTSTHLQ